MSLFLIAVALVVAATTTVGLYRVQVGPTVFDRLIAIALLTVNTVVLIALLGFIFERPIFFLDIALSYALLTFVFPIALGRYFSARDDGGSGDGA